MARARRLRSICRPWLLMASPCLRRAKPDLLIGRVVLIFGAMFALLLTDPCWSAERVVAQDSRREGSMRYPQRGQAIRIADDVRTIRLDLGIRRGAVERNGGVALDL